MSRAYLVFGSDDGVHWELLNTVEASGGEQAMNKAREQQQFREYGACPERNWTKGTPRVIERPPVVKWEYETDGQMIVEEALEAEPEPKHDKEEVIREAKEALAAKPEAAAGAEEE